jgi:hypothetical protein
VEIRRKWLELLRHTRVKFVFSSSSATVSEQNAFATSTTPSKSGAKSKGASGSSQYMDSTGEPLKPSEIISMSQEGDGDSDSDNDNEDASKDAGIDETQIELAVGTGEVKKVADESDDEVLFGQVQTYGMAVIRYSLQGFLNVDEKYEGPLLVSNSSFADRAAVAEASSAAAPASSGASGACIVTLREDSAHQQFFALSELPRVLL